MKIILILLVILAIASGFVAIQPSEFRVQRSTTISAPPAVVFSQVNDFHNWEAWSPWAKLDPDAKKTFEGPVAGNGASFAWAGNNAVGKGRMTITESRPDDLIKIKLDFVKPFTATNEVEFTFKPEGDQTLVTWSVTGKKDFVGKAFSLIMNCEKMISDYYDKGLANLKAVSEAAAKVN